MRNTRMRLGAALLVAGLALGAAGAAASAGESVGHHAERSKAGATTTSKRRVRIVDYAFSPKTITISRGTRVRWVNTGAVAHTSTSNTGRWDSGVIAPGNSFSRVFRRAGTFRYHCAIHPTMKAKIIVE